MYIPVIYELKTFYGYIREIGGEIKAMFKGEELPLPSDFETTVDQEAAQRNFDLAQQQLMKKEGPVTDEDWKTIDGLALKLDIARRNSAQLEKEKIEL